MAVTPAGVARDCARLRRPARRPHHRSTATTATTCNARDGSRGGDRHRGRRLRPLAGLHGRRRRQGPRRAAGAHRRRARTAAAAAAHGGVCAHEGREARARRAEAHRAGRRPHPARRRGPVGRAVGRRQGRRRRSHGCNASRAKRARSRGAPACRSSTARSPAAELAAIARARRRGGRGRPPPLQLAAARAAASGWSPSGPRAASTPAELAAFGHAPRLAVGTLRPPRGDRGDCGDRRVGWSSGVFVRLESRPQRVVTAVTQ